MIRETRRQILKLIGLSPVAATSARMELRSTLAGPTGTALSALAAGATPLTALESPVAKTLGVAAYRKFESLQQRVDRELWDARAVRENGLDADIAALRSTSRAYKARKQFERDSEAFDLYNQITRYLWP